MNQLLLYRPVHGLIGVDFSLLDLPISQEEALAVLKKDGYEDMPTRDILVDARACKDGASLYRRYASINQAPEIVHCATFIRWLYGNLGIWLPKTAFLLREYGMMVQEGDHQVGDLIFSSSRRSIGYYWTDEHDGVGHVGMVSGNNTVIHAANSKLNIIEESFEDFYTDYRGFRGIRRIVPDLKNLVTLKIPHARREKIELMLEIRKEILKHF